MRSTIVVSFLYAVSLAEAHAQNVLTFSHPEGFYDAPFELEVTGATPDTIYYTLDGSVPDEESGVYADGLPIESPLDAPDVFALIPTTPPQPVLRFKAWTPPRFPLHKARVARFASYVAGVRTSPIYTKTFFTDGPLADRYTVPVVSLVVDSNSFFDYDTGIHVAGATYRPAAPDYSGNATQQGRDWERPIHVTYFDVSGVPRVSQDAGIRIHGGSSRIAAQKSLRLYARKAYGTRSFEHAFFPDLGHADYKRLLLRTTMSDFAGFAMIKDAVAHEFIRDLDLESQRFRPVIVYLNGEYWGIYTLMERIDERYVGYRFGLNPDHVEILDMRRAGKTEGWSLVDFVEDNDMSADEHYAVVNERIDIENLITYTIAEQFLGNSDWPIINHKYWRETGRSKWRAIAYDFDGAFGDPEHDMFAQLMIAPDHEGWPSDAFSTALFRNLIDNADFRARYVERFGELLATTFNADTTLARLARVRARYRPEVAGHANRWDYPDSVEAWDSIVDRQIRDFLERRPAIARRQVEAFFQLSDVATCCGSAPVAPRYVTPIVSAGRLVLRNPSDREATWARVQVADLSGRAVAQWRDVRVAPGGTHALRLPATPPGNYVVLLQSASATVAERVVVVE